MLTETNSLSLREAVRARYDAGAAAYERHWAPALICFSAPILDQLELEPGRALLDLAAGTCRVARRAAPRLLPGGMAVCLDLSAAMLAVGRRAARREGITNLVTVVGDVRDGPHLPLQPFDAATCAFALHLMDAPVEILRAVRSLLRPGARIGVVTWGLQDPPVGAQRIWDELIRSADLPPDPAPYPPTSRAFGTEAELSEALRAAGFGDVTATARPQRYLWDAASYLGMKCNHGADARRLAVAAPALRRRVRQLARRRFARLPPEAFLWQPEVIYGVGAA